jgi:hypothetical protein
MRLAIDPDQFMRVMALPPELRRDVLEFVGATRLPSDRVTEVLEAAVARWRDRPVPGRQ